MRWIVGLLLVIGCGGSTTQKPPPVAPVPAPPPVASEPVGIPAGYVEMWPGLVVPTDDGAALLLLDEAKEMALPIFIGGTEALSIDYRMRGEKFRRPLTHDLLDSVLRETDAKLVKVHVDALRDGTFHGSVFIRAKGRVIRIDARPSDAIALAIGSRVPIYVAKSVLDEAGIKHDELRKQMNQGPPPITS